MGNIGRSSTGCGLCRKRKIKVSMTVGQHITPALTIASATRVNQAANGVLKSENHVQATPIKSNWRSASWELSRLPVQVISIPSLSRLFSPETSPRPYQRSKSTIPSSGPRRSRPRLQQTRSLFINLPQLILQSRPHLDMTSTINPSASSSTCFVTKPDDSTPSQSSTSYRPCWRKPRPIRVSAWLPMQSLA